MADISQALADAEKQASPISEDGANNETSSETNSDNQPKPFYDEGDNLRRKATNTSLDSRDATQEMHRIMSETSSRIRRRDTNRPIPAMGGGKDYPPLLPDRAPYEVEFDGPDDPMFPHNWPLKRKILICVALGYTTLVTAWGSAIYASAAEFVAEEFHVATVVSILGVSLYVFGFASGPIIWAPLSEMLGRKIPLVISAFGLAVFEFGCAAAKDLQTVLLCRFFAGFVGAAPLAVVAAAFADMFSNEYRGTALALFSATVFMGPIAAPVVGGFISYSYLGWRWTQYITGIMASLAFILDIFVYEESYHPIILANKAKELRRRTGNWGIYAPQETLEVDFSELIQKNLSRPIVMLFTEPIVLLITIYTAFLYGILYLFLEAYPLVFAGQYHFYKGIAELPYLGLCVGQAIAVAVLILVFEPQYKRALAANNGKPVPEARLPGAIVGAVMFTIGLFWFTWTGNYPDKVHWAVPTVSGIFTGYGLLSIFLCAINYIVDAYLFFAASAMAANTFLRSSFGAAFPLFAGFMFNNMGINWAGTLLGCVAAALIPVPVLFYFYGKRIRQRSKFAFDL